MGNWFVSALAAGGGSGTVNSPWAIGEAMSSINGGTVVNGDTVWFKNDGTYVTSTFDINVAGGVSTAKRLKGYNTTLNDNGVAVIKHSGTSLVLLDIPQNYWIVEQFKINGNGGSTDNVVSGSRTMFVKVESVSAGSDKGFQTGQWIDCYAHHNTGDGFWAGNAAFCLADSNGGNGYSICNCFNCVSKNNTSDNFRLGSDVYRNFGVNMISYAGNRHGFNMLWNAIAINAIAMSSPSAQYGVKFASDFIYADNIDMFANSSNTDSVASIRNYTTVDPQFTSVPSDDYRRTGSNLDNEGFNEIGMKSATGYRIDIGIDQSGGDFPVQGNVRSSTSYRGTVYSGNLGLPVAGDVRSGTTYGSNSSEITGTMAQTTQPEPPRYVVRSQQNRRTLRVRGG